ncbi:Multicopper oxidase, type 1 [Corchorus capsularis]|uniref:Multicopper oxidase, type 1 n=1 Tax=Corchorus capsularis TaxID=210143 RepID=A0A1R3J221_COCAP|nr:Multicopper oxidase, type 1 [Corchorus capsularis]
MAADYSSLKWILVWAALVITINGMFPGPLINATTNDVLHINVFNLLDEPLLFTWNGIQQRLNSWQDGVSGTNCPIMPSTNWTYVFQIKDQIGSFFYFPSINFQKAAGGYGPIRVHNRDVIPVPFPKPESEFDLLIGDWYAGDYKYYRTLLKKDESAYDVLPDAILMNGKAPYDGSEQTVYESLFVDQGKTYRFRISNIGSSLSFNFRIQNHKLLLVETEGSYTNQIPLDSLDVHVGQSYSVLVTADQFVGDYYIVASSKYADVNIEGLGVLHYSNSSTPVNGPKPDAPLAFDLDFSVNQAKSISLNLTAGAARPNPQGTFKVTNVIPSQTFILESSRRKINGEMRLVVNNMSYSTPETPLKLADHLRNGSGVYTLDQFPIRPVNGENAIGDKDGDWTPASRNSYNLLNPIVRSTTQVYPNRWTAVYVFLDNPGMWNLRSQNLKNWFLGEELYIRVFDADLNPAKERPPPGNLLLCGIFNQSNVSTPAPAP